MVMGGSSHPGALEEPLQPVAPVPPHGRTSRRTLLRGAGALGVAALGAGWAMEEGVMPGGDRLRAVVGREDPTAIPRAHRGNLLTGSFRSPARNGRRSGWTMCWPHGVPTGTRLPVLLMLHGRGSHHNSVFDGLGMDRFLNRAVEDGLAPFAIASVDGGTDYWKPAPDGSDASRMLVDEFVPLMADHGLDTSRISMGGWSMGGYGSLRIAGLHLMPVRSVATLAPALHDNESADDVLRNPGRLEGTPLQISVGRADPFYDLIQRYVRGLRADGIEPELHVGEGAHGQKFWRAFVPSLLQFTGRHLNG